MFEKCGLRDILIRIKQYIIYILIIMIVFAAIGALQYRNKKAQYNTQMAEIETQTDSSETAQSTQTTVPGEGKVWFGGTANYYISLNADGAEVTEEWMELTAQSYIAYMKEFATNENIFLTLLQNHDVDELSELMNKDKFANGITQYRYCLFNNAFTLTADEYNTVLTLTVNAETNEMCAEFLNVCRSFLEAYDATTTGSTLVFENQLIKQERLTAPVTAQTTTTAAAQTDTEEEEELPTAPSLVKTVGMWLAIGFILAILIVICIAVLFPTLNRAEDFAMYDIASLGEVKGTNVKMQAHLLAKKIFDKNAQSIALVTSLKKSRAYDAFCADLAAELEKYGLVTSVSTKDAERKEGTFPVVTVKSPDRICTQSDLCASCDLVVMVEKKAQSKHKRFGEMVNYLEQMEMAPDAAILLV